MIIDVNLYLRNENEEIHRPVSVRWVRTPTFTVNKRKGFSGVAKNAVMDEKSTTVVLGLINVACLVLVSTGKKSDGDG